MARLGDLCACVFVLFPLGCYTPQPRQQNSEVLLYHEEGYQIIDFLRQQKMYRIDGLLYDEFLKQRHLIDQRYQNALQNPEKVIEVLEILDRDHDHRISIPEALHALFSQKTADHLIDILEKP